MEKGGRRVSEDKKIIKVRINKANETSAALFSEKEVRRFVTLCGDHPEAVQTHPIFGPLVPEEWHRSHFKHCHHHLQQFGLIAKGEEDGRARNDSPTPHT